MGDRSESNARSYAACPRSGTGPPGFLAGIPGKGLTTQTTIAEPQCSGMGPEPIAFSCVAVV